MDELEQAKLKMEALLLAVVQIVECAQHNLQIARDLFFAKEHCGARSAGALVARNLQQFGLLAADFCHQRIAQVANHLPGKR